ncbi:MAG: hypothetical protein RL758_1625 [Pseudomonadota bacterium]|jgi:hypothetical protein
MNSAEKDRATLYSLADTMSKTRDELDGMRLVVQALSATMNARPELRPIFAAELQTAIDKDAATSLNSLMTDAQLERRAAWITRLVQRN